MFGESEIATSVLSDHDPASLGFTLGSNVGREWHWRLNESILGDSKITQEFLKDLKIFFVNEWDTGSFSTNNMGSTQSFY